MIRRKLFIYWHLIRNWMRSRRESQENAAALESLADPDLIARMIEE